MALGTYAHGFLGRRCMMVLVVVVVRLRVAFRSIRPTFWQAGGSRPPRDAGGSLPERQHRGEALDCLVN